MLIQLAGGVSLICDAGSPAVLLGNQRRRAPFIKSKPVTDDPEGSRPHSQIKGNHVHQDTDFADSRCLFFSEATTMRTNTNLRSLAAALGGEISGGQVLAPGPGHSAEDRSLSIKLDANAPDGFLVYSFANDDPIKCRDYVRERAGWATWKPNGGRQHLDFAARHADTLRYVATRAQWVRYDGCRWAFDETLLAFDLARRICRDAATACNDAREAKFLASAKTVAAVERLAKADRRLASAMEQWDHDDWALNTTAQTFDLRTGSERAVDPADFITKATACAAVPQGTPHPLWSKFLDRITNSDTELQAFLQRYVGYCCTGITSQHQFVFGYGTGANGKGTFINTVAKILADYATVADVGTFIASNTERHPTDVAKLHGARLVIAQETEKGRRWDEAKIKAMTGGDKMTARFMRQDFFDFVPKFKLFITGNHKPRLDNVDEAMRRRLLLVPFTVQIPPEERDPDLPGKLKPEWPAILRWMIDGCLEWQRVGLAPPKIVTDATKDYFDDQDVVRQWLDDCTEDGGPYAFTRASELFGSWRQWCDKRNLKPGSGNVLSDALADRGFERKREPGTGQRGFKRLALRQG